MIRSERRQGLDYEERSGKDAAMWMNKETETLMTNPDALWEELERLASPEEARKVEASRNRSNFRPPFTAATVDILDVSQPYMETLDNGRQRRVVGLLLGNFRDVEYANGKSANDLPDEYELKLPLPDKASANSEFYLTVNGIKAHRPALTVAQFKGLKGVRLEEDTHSYTARGFIEDPLNGTMTDRQTGKLGYFGDKQFTTYYYRAVSIGGSANGATAPAAKLSDELRMAALAVLEGKSSPDEFSAVVMKDEAVLAFPAADRAVLGVQVMNGSFIRDAVTDGLVTVNDGVYELRVPA